MPRCALLPITRGWPSDCAPAVCRSGARCTAGLPLHLNCAWVLGVRRVGPLRWSPFQLRPMPAPSVATVPHLVAPAPAAQSHVAAACVREAPSTPLPTNPFRTAGHSVAHGQSKRHRLPLTTAPSRQAAGTICCCTPTAPPPPHTHTPLAYAPFHANLPFGFAMQPVVCRLHRAAAVLGHSLSRHNTDLLACARVDFQPVNMGCGHCMVIRPAARQICKPVCCMIGIALRSHGGAALPQFSRRACSACRGVCNGRRRA